MSTRAEKIACRASWRDEFFCGFSEDEFFNSHSQYGVTGADALTVG
jgi:hypothetical protein